MKRSAPLRRTSPLRRSTPLHPTPMPARSAWRRRPRPDAVPRAAREAVRQRSGGRCEIAAEGCTGTPTDWAHRKRRGEGDHRPVNGLDACRRCHDRCHANPAEAMRCGWIVPTWADPATVPVLLRGRWVLLEEEAA